MIPITNTYKSYMLQMDQSLENCSHLNRLSINTFKLNYNYEFEQF